MRRFWRVRWVFWRREVRWAVVLVRWRRRWWEEGVWERVWRWVRRGEEGWGIQSICHIFAYIYLAVCRAWVCCIVCIC